MTFAGSLSHIFSNMANPSATNTVPSSAVETESGGFHVFELHLPSSGGTILLIFIGLMVCLLLKKIFCGCGCGNCFKIKKSRSRSSSSTQQRERDPDRPLPSVAFSSLEDQRQILLDFFYQQHLERQRQERPRALRRPDFTPDRFTEVTEVRPCAPTRRAPAPPRPGPPTTKPTRPSQPATTTTTTATASATSSSGPSSQPVLHF